MHAADSLPLLSKSKAETRKSPRITMLPKALSGSLVTRFVASLYLPWFPTKERYARLRLPCSGSRAVSTSPPYRMPFSSIPRYYAPLRLPKALLVKLRFVRLSSHDTLHALDSLCPSRCTNTGVGSLQRPSAIALLRQVSW
jgi:hypothetical protein